MSSPCYKATELISQERQFLQRLLNNQESTIDPWGASGTQKTPWHRPDKMH